MNFMRAVVVEDPAASSAEALLARQLGALRAAGWRVRRLGATEAWMARAPVGHVKANLATADTALRLADRSSFYISDDSSAADGRGAPFYLRRAVRRRIPTIMIGLNPLP